jgi:hypothetical protein
MEPPPPETYDPAVDAYRSWLLAIDALHDLMVVALVADHEAVGRLSPETEANHFNDLEFFAVENKPFGG